MCFSSETSTARGRQPLALQIIFSHALTTIVRGHKSAPHDSRYTFYGSRSAHHSFSYGTPSAAGGIERPTTPANTIIVTR